LFKKSSAGHSVGVQTTQTRFNLEWYPLLFIPDNDMIDEDIDYILLQINMSVPLKILKSRRCALVAFTCSHIHKRRTRHVTCGKNYKYLLRQVKDICFRF